MSNTLTPQLADVAIQFLSRVSLQGNEVNAFVAVRQALESVANSVGEAPPWDEPTVKEVKDEPDMKLK